MKTAIFINTYAKFSNYDFSHLSEYDVKKIAIISKNEYEKFNNSYGKYFSEIHSCCNDLTDDSIEGEAYQFSRDILHKELSIAGNDVRIICLSEDTLLLAARLRDEVKIPGLKFDHALCFREKTIMKDVLLSEGIRTPRYIKFFPEEAANFSTYFAYLQTQLGLPFVLKPTSFLGGYGVVMVNCLEEFEKFCKASDPSTPYEAEEFITGTLFHCDSIRAENKNLFSVCCEYSHPNFDFQLGKPVISIPLSKDNNLTKKIFDFNERVLQALKLENGVSHHELFLTPQNELVFLEIAARSPGAIITPMYRRAFNIAFEDIDFKQQMGIPFELPPEGDLSLHYFSGIFPLREGKVKELISPQIRSTYDMKWIVNVDDQVTGSTSLRDKSASIIAWNPNYSDLYEDFQYLKSFHPILVA